MTARQGIYPGRGGFVGEGVGGGEPGIPLERRPAVGSWMATVIRLSGLISSCPVMALGRSPKGLTDSVTGTGNAVRRIRRIQRTRGRKWLAILGTMLRIQASAA
jgi:hypothetical protein